MSNTDPEQDAEIQTIRDEIDEVDDEFSELLARRGNLTVRMIAAKGGKVAVRQPIREEQIKQRVVPSHKGPYAPDRIANIYDAIFDASCELQERTAQSPTETETT